MASRGFGAARVLVVEAAELQALPFDEIAIVDRVQRMQLSGVYAAPNAEDQRLGGLQLDLEFAGQQAAAHFQMDQWAEIGLSDAQVDIDRKSTRLNSSH